MPLLLERALFVVAPRNSGKSTTLRSIFLDRRFGTNGIPTQPKLPDSYYISNERRLYLRLTSPHESDETPEEFFTKAEDKMPGGRWCYAGPFQPAAFKQMPDVVESVEKFAKRFKPERIRVAFLSPNHRGSDISTFLQNRDLMADLLSIPKVEVMCLDGRQKEKNGLLLADFFDFT